MKTRLDLQYNLEEILGSNNVYFQPDISVKMHYPAIVYSINRRDAILADDDRYVPTPNYKLVYISKTYDEATIEKILKLPWCGHDTSYKSDGMYHDVFTLYK